MNQKDAVFAAVVKTIGFTPDESVTLNGTDKATVAEILTQQFLAGEIEFTDSSKSKYDTESKIRSYARSLLSNYLRRDSRLTGGNPVPTTKSTGTRVKDEQIVAMKALRKQLVNDGNTAGIAEVDEEINGRISELAMVKAEYKAHKASESKKASIDLSKIPADLLDSLKI